MLIFPNHILFTLSNKKGAQELGNKRFFALLTPTTYFNSYAINSLSYLFVPYNKKVLVFILFLLKTKKKKDFCFCFIYVCVFFEI